MASDAPYDFTSFSLALPCPGLGSYLHALLFAVLVTFRVLGRNKESTDKIWKSIEIKHYDIHGI